MSKELPDSSEARVRPHFDELLSHDETGASWLSTLLSTAAHSDRIPARLRDHPGQLLRESVEPGPGGRRRCFERPVPPPAAFLEWLIRNPHRMHWPRRGGKPIAYGEPGQALREDLLSGDSGRVQTAQRIALDLLDERTSLRSRRQWWAFEGFTFADCWLETEKLILLVEGKWREQLSSSTDWFRERNQLVRNLEIVHEEAGPGRVGLVLLAVEHEVPEPTNEKLQASTPHLDSDQRAALWNRYLGQVPWASLRTHLLPASVAEEPTV